VLLGTHIRTKKDLLTNILLTYNNQSSGHHSLRVTVHDAVLNVLLVHSISCNCPQDTHKVSKTNTHIIKRVTNIRLLSLNICCSILLSNKFAQQCWATNVERFSMSHIWFLSQLCRSTKVAQNFLNLGDKSRATFSEWCRVIGQLAVYTTAAMFTMEMFAWTK